MADELRYPTLLKALHSRFAAVRGVRAVLDHEPRTIQQSPTLYSLLDRVERSQAGQVTTMRYRVLHRCCIAWQDSEKAEQLLVALLNPLASALDADPQLGGVVSSGMARVTDVEAVFVTIGGALYRALDIYSEIIDKHPVRTAGH